MLEDYALVCVGGLHLIGRVDGPAIVGAVLSPVFEFGIQYGQDEAGNMGVLKQCVPLFGSGSIDRVEIPVGAVIVRCEDMSAKERETWSRAINQAAEMKKAIRMAESGLVVAPANTKLPPAESLLAGGR